MFYYVSMQQSDLQFSFATVFSAADAATILEAIVGKRFELEDGFGTLFPDGDVVLTLKSPGGQRMTCLNHAELCRQLEHPQED